MMAGEANYVKNLIWMNVNTGDIALITINLINH